MIEKFKQFKLEVENLLDPYKNKVSELEADNSKLHNEKVELLKKADEKMAELNFSEAKKLRNQADKLTEKVNENLEDIQYVRNIIKNGNETINKKKKELQKVYDELRVYFLDKDVERNEKIHQINVQIEEEREKRIGELNKEYEDILNANSILTNILINKI